MERDFDRTDRSVRGETDSLGKLSAVASAVASALAVRQVVSYADAWTNLQNQLRQVTDSQEELNRVTDRLLGIANDTRSGIASTANLYEPALNSA
ncbi:tape measure protein [Salinicola halophyticus]|uniref:tape measure protein n=1 Tax=Salinicola halophyticus TaxID=1808881 RepID=UPI003F45A89A